MIMLAFPNLAYFYVSYVRSRKLAVLLFNQSDQTRGHKF